MNAKKKYTVEDLESALIAINNGSSVYKASREYNIPETTLRDKRDQKYSGHIAGRKTVLSKSEETKIVDWIHYLGKHGFPVSKEQLKQGVAKLVENLNRPNTFKDGMPGKHWLANFLSRHPTVAKRVAQTLPTHRNKINEQDVRNWFDRVKSYFETNNLLGVLEDESRVYNCDETAFFLCPKEKDVLVKKGSKRVYNRVANDEKECLTVLVNVSAGGKIAPPMVLYPYKRLPKNLPLTVPPTWGIGCTESGWMNMEAFYEYVANVFYKWLLENKITLPIALFMDGHTSHISLPLSLFCKEKGIILVALLPNSTHLLQPLDVGVFRPVKGTWKNVVHDFRVNNNYAKLKRTDFAMEVKKCFDISIKVDTIKNSFRSAGIFPFDANNIDFSKVMPRDSREATAINSQDQLYTKEKNSFFEKFEQRLAPEVLQLFVESGNEWEGEEKYRCLFGFWKKIQQEEPPPIFNDTTIANNIRDCDISDVVSNIEIGPNGSIILPLSLSPRSIMSHDIPQLDMDQTLTPGNNHSRRYSSDSILQIETSLGHNITEDEPQPCCSRTQILPLSLSPRSIMSHDIPQLDMDQTLTPGNNHSRRYSSDSILQIESLGHITEDVPQPCCSRTQHFQSSPPMSRQSSSDPTLDIFHPADNTNNANQSTNNIIAVKSTPNKKPNFPTPFKTAFYFPQSPKKTMTRKTKKQTPTVATANDFIEYQRRIAKENEEKAEGILKRRADRLKKQEERKSKKNKTIQKRKTVRKTNNLDKINERQETEGNIEDDNIHIDLRHRRNNPFSLNSESSSNDEDFTLTMRNKTANRVKKTYTTLFGESTSDSSM